MPMIRWLLPSLALLAGCAGGRGVDVETVLAWDRCEGLRPGLTRVDLAALAGIRGTTLLGAPARPATPAAGDGLLLIAVSRGDQPTPGYGLSLQSARLDGATAVLELNWQTPEPGAMLAQVITHPCLVVGIADAAGIGRVEAVDQHGKRLGGVDL
ncbi:MAG: protease complex subunit PrcB family protein [Pseudomonadales bacterium]